MRHAAFDFDPPTETVATPPKVQPRRLFDRAKAWGLPAASFAAIWWAFNPGDPASWIIGAPAILAATATVVLIRTNPAPAISLPGLARFVRYFAVQSVVGATDVALRAMTPSARTEPGFLGWRTHLPEGAPREAFANAITLLPGTLTARMEGDVFTIHLLDTRNDPSAELAALETRVADLFGLSAERTKGHQS